MPEEMLTQPLDPKAPGFAYDLRRLIEMLRRGWRLLAASLALSLTMAIVYLFVNPVPGSSSVAHYSSTGPAFECRQSRSRSTVGRYRGIHSDASGNHFQSRRRQT